MRREGDFSRREGDTRGGDLAGRGGGAPVTILGVQGFVSSTNWYDSTAGAPDTLFTSVPFSVGLIAKFPSTPAANGQVFGTFRNAAGGVIRYDNSGDVWLRYRDGSAANQTSQTLAVGGSPGWYALVWTTDGSFLRAYQEAGEIAPPISVNAGIAAPTSEASVGARDLGDVAFVGGVVAGVQYSTAYVSAAQAQAWCTAAKAAGDVVSFPSGNEVTYSARQAGMTPGAAPATWADELGNERTLNRNGALTVIEESAVWQN